MFSNVFWTAGTQPRPDAAAGASARYSHAPNFADGIIISAQGLISPWGAVMIILLLLLVLLISIS
jgi:hypothetical protein